MADLELEKYQAAVNAYESYLTELVGRVPVDADEYLLQLLVGCYGGDCRLAAQALFGESRLFSSRKNRDGTPRFDYTTVTADGETLTNTPRRKQSFVDDVSGVSVVDRITRELAQFQGKEVDASKLRSLIKQRATTWTEGLPELPEGEKVTFNTLLLGARSSVEFLSHRRSGWVADRLLANVARLRQSRRQVIKANFEQVLEDRLKPENSDGVRVLDEQQIELFTRLFAGQDGYAKLARFTGHTMNKTFMLVSAIVNVDIVRNEFGWQAFPGTPQEHQELTAEVEQARKDGSLNGMNGYLAFAEKHGYTMLKAFMLVSAIVVNVDVVKNEFGWQQFPGTTQEYRELTTEIEQARKDGLLNGMNGYLAFAEKHGYTMLKAYTMVSAVVGVKIVKDEFGWQQFPGTAQEYRELTAEIEQARKDGLLNGMNGYLAFAEKHGYTMDKAYMMVSAIVGGVDVVRYEFGWQQFQGTPQEYRDVVEFLKNDEHYQAIVGVDGQRWVAANSGSTAQKTFMVTSAALHGIGDPNKTIQDLGWSSAL